MTQAQTDASRANGAKSKGPVTIQGKAISSRNALHHGATAKAITLSIENSDAYIRLSEAYYQKFQPADEVECDLIDELAVCRWRLNRDLSNEAALYELEMDRQTKDLDEKYSNMPHPARFAFAFKALADESKCIALLHRYETSHRRAFHQVLNAFLKLRSQFHSEPDPQDEIPESCETNPATPDPPPIDPLTPAAPTPPPASSTLPTPAGPSSPSDPSEKIAPPAPLPIPKMPDPSDNPLK